MGNSSSSLSRRIANAAREHGLTARSPQLQAIAKQVSGSPEVVAAKNAAVDSAVASILGRLRGVSRHIPGGERFVISGVAELMDAVIPVAAEFGYEIVPIIGTIVAATDIPIASQIALSVSEFVQLVGEPIKNVIVAQNAAMANYLRERYGRDVSDSTQGVNEREAEQLVEVAGTRGGCDREDACGGFAPVWSNGNYLGGRAYRDAMHRAGNPIAVTAGDDSVSVSAHPHYGADDSVSVSAHPHFGANHPADLFRVMGSCGDSGCDCCGDRAGASTSASVHTGGAGSADAPTIAIADLAKYTDSVNAKTKDQIVDDIIRAMAQLGFKAQGEDRLSKIKSIIATLPNGDKFKSTDESHRRVCSSIAHVLNDVYGTQVIDPDLAPQIVCRQVLEIVRSLAVGMHTEFLSVYAEAKTVLNNMHLLNLAVDENLSQVRDAVSAHNDVALSARVGYNFQVYDMLRAERDRQLALMKNLLNVELLPTERDVATLLRSIDENTASHIEKLDWKSGQSDFGKLIAASLKGMTLTAAFAETINNALKKVGMSVAKYISTTDPGKFLDEMADLYLARSPMSDKESEEVREAIKLLYKNFYRNTDIGAMLSKKSTGATGGDDNIDSVAEMHGGMSCGKCGGDGPCACSRVAGHCQCAGDCMCGREAAGGFPAVWATGGDRERYPKSAVDRRVKSLRAMRNLIFSAFYRRLQELFGQVVSSLDMISRKVGTEIPLSDNLDSFRHIIQRIRESLIENKSIYMALIGYYNDALSKQKRETLLGELRMISSAVDALLEMDLYRPSAQYFRDFQNGIKAIVELIDKYSGEMAAKLGRGDDEACQYLDERDSAGKSMGQSGAASANGMSASASTSGVSANGVPTSGAGEDERIASDLRAGGKDEVPFDLPMEIKRTSRTIYDSFRQFDYYYRSAQIRENLAAASKELGNYGEKYEALTAASIARVLQDASDKYEATREFLERLEVKTDGGAAKSVFPDAEIAGQKDAALKILKQQWEARKRFWATSEAIDTYMRVFTDGIVKDPSSIRKIEAMLDDVEVLNDTYTNETGERFAAIFEKFPGRLVALSGAEDSPLKDNTDYTSHYYTKVAAAVTKSPYLGNPYNVALPADGLAARGLARDVISGLGMLKNFMSIFIFVGGKFGGNELRNRVFMTPTQIYNNIVDYIQASAFCQGFASGADCEFKREGTRLVVPESWSKPDKRPVLGVALNIKNLRDANRDVDRTVGTRSLIDIPEDLVDSDSRRARKELGDIQDKLAIAEREVDDGVQHVAGLSTADAMNALMAASGAYSPHTGGGLIGSAVSKLVDLIISTPKRNGDVKFYSTQREVAADGSEIRGLPNDSQTGYLGDYSRVSVGVSTNDWISMEPASKLNFKRLFGVWMRSVIPDLQKYELHGFQTEDLHFVMMMKSLAAKVFTVTGTYDVFDRPHESNSISPIRMILGGDDGIPKVEQGAVELYLRLPLLAQFYRDLFRYDSDEYYNDLKDIPRKDALNLKISMIPEVEGVFSGLIKFVFRRTKDVYETAYSDNEIRTLIAEINIIYQRMQAKHGAKVVSGTIRDFIDEVNRRYSIVTKHDHDEFERHFGEPYDYTYGVGSEQSPNYDRYDQVPPEDVALLPNEGQPEIRRMSPAERLVQDSRGFRTKDPLARHRLADGYHRLLYRFRCTIDKIFESSDASEEFSFKNAIRAATLRLAATQKDADRLRIVSSLIRGVDVYSKIDGMRYLLFHETVIAGLNSLSAVHTLLQSFRDLAVVINLHTLQDLVLKYMETFAIGKPSFYEVCDFAFKYFKNKVRVSIPETKLKVLLALIFGRLQDTRSIGGKNPAATDDIKQIDGIPAGIDRGAVSVRVIKYDGKQKLSGFTSGRTYRANETLITTGASLSVGARSGTASGLWGLLAGFSTQELREALSSPKSTPARKAATTFFRFLFNREYVMRVLVETLYGLCGDASSVADFRVEEGKLFVNVGGVKPIIDDLFANLSYFIDAFRPFLPQDYLDKYVSKINPGAYYWLHEQIVERLLVGRPAQRYEQGVVKDKPEYITIDKAAKGLSMTYDILTLKYECDGSGISAGSSSTLRSANSLTQFTKYDKVFAEMIFYNAALETSGIAISKAASGVDAARDYAANSPTAFVDFRNNPYDALHFSGHGPQKLIDTRFINRYLQLYSWDDEYNFNRSVLFAFNQLVAKYIKQSYDPASSKIYINTINAFANGQFSQSVLDFHYTYPDVVPAVFVDPKDPANPNRITTIPFDAAIRAKLVEQAGAITPLARDAPQILPVTDRFLTDAGSAIRGYNVADLKSNNQPSGTRAADFGNRMDPDGQHVLFTSLANVLKNLISTRNPSNQQHVYLSESVSDVPLYMKEKYRASMPLFALLFRHLSARCAHIQKFISRPEICLDRTHWDDTARGVPQDNPWPFVLVRPATDSETTRARFNGILDSVVRGCAALITGCEQVMREVGDDPKYFELSAGSIRDYKNQHGVDPFMPLSSAMRIYRNLRPDDCCDALPVYSLGDNRFKFQYGTRQLLAQPQVAISQEHVPGYTHIMDSYNALIESRNQIDKKRAGEFLKTAVRVLRYVFEMRQIRGMLTNYVVDLLVVNEQLSRAGRGSSALYCQGLFTRTDMVLDDIVYNSRYLVSPAESISNTPPAPVSMFGQNFKNIVKSDATIAGRQFAQQIIKPLYQIEKPLAQTIMLTESSLRDEKVREIVSYVSETECDIRSMVVQNIIDLNVIPINVHAMMREIPLANLYNYSYTFDRMIIELYYGLQNANARKLMSELCYDQDTSEGVSTSALRGIKSAKDMMVALLIRPYMFAGHGEHCELGKDMLLGVSGNELGRPKFLSDQLYGKCVFGELYESQDVYSEAGPPGGHERTEAVNSADIAHALAAIGLKTVWTLCDNNETVLDADTKQGLYNVMLDLYKFCKNKPLDTPMEDIVTELKWILTRYRLNNSVALLALVTNNPMAVPTDEINVEFAKIRSMFTAIVKCLIACSTVLTRKFHRDTADVFNIAYAELSKHILSNIHRAGKPNPISARGVSADVLDKLYSGIWSDDYAGFSGRSLPPMPRNWKFDISYKLSRDRDVRDGLPLSDYSRARQRIHYLDNGIRSSPDEFGATIQPDNENVLDRDQIREVEIGGTDNGILLALGKLRFNTKFVRNLIFIVNLYRSVRLKLQRDLVYNRDVILKSASITRPSITEFVGNSIYKKRKRYGKDSSDVKGDRDHRYELYKY
jgi:hypothetical protein